MKPQTILPQGYVMFNGKTMPEPYRDRYNHAQVIIEGLKEQGYTESDSKLRDWLNHSHQVMQGAISVTL